MSSSDLLSVSSVDKWLAKQKANQRALFDISLLV